MCHLALCEPVPDFDDAGLDTPEADLGGLRRLVGQVRRGALKDGRDHVCVVEVGAYVGRTALNFLRCGQVRVWSIDHWKGNGDPADPINKTIDALGEECLFQTFCKNVGRHLFEEIIPCRGDSLFWAAIWPWQADLVFIDAGHTYEDVKADIAAWAPRVRPGGILCGHDFDKGFPGVIRAAEEFGIDGVVGERVWWRGL